jgi:hypothetical protein
MVEDSYTREYGLYFYIVKEIDCCIELKSWCWNLLIDHVSPICSRSWAHYLPNNAFQSLPFANISSEDCVC